jgi:hypothetical protein
MPLPSNLSNAVKQGAPKIRRAPEAKPWTIAEARGTICKMVDDWLHYNGSGEWTRKNKKGDPAKLTHLVNVNNGVYGVNIKYMTEPLVDDTMNWTGMEEAVEWLGMFKDAINTGAMDEEIVFIKNWCLYRNGNYNKKNNSKSDDPTVNAERREQYKGSDDWKKVKDTYKDITFTVY